MCEEHIRPISQNGIRNMEIVREKVRNDNNANNVRILHHMERYEFMAQYLLSYYSKDQSIDLLDAGCGLSYGMNIIKNVIDNQMYLNLVGIDIDSSTIKRASEINKEASFFCQDICDISLLKKYDVIILFEVLGNAAIDSDQFLLAKLKNLLKPNGLIFISIPSYGDKQPRDYFKRLYNQQIFNDLIKKIFNNWTCNFYGQFYPKNRSDIVEESPIRKEYFSDGNFMLVAIEAGEIENV